MHLFAKLVLSFAFLLASCAKPTLSNGSNVLPLSEEKIAHAQTKAPRSETCAQIKSWFEDEYAINDKPRNMGKALHNGFDIKAPIGTQVITAAPGVVVLSYYLYSSGNVVWIDHGRDTDGNQIYSFSAHLSVRSVRRGDGVRRGDVIGLSGDSGAGVGAEGPHLHFGVAMRNAQLVLRGIDPSDIPSLLNTEPVSPNLFLYPISATNVGRNLPAFFPEWNQSINYGDGDWHDQKRLTGFTFPIRCKK